MPPLTCTTPAALALPAARRQAMQAPVTLDGVWRGTTCVLLPDGRPREPVSTERVGPVPGGGIQWMGQ